MHTTTRSEPTPHAVGFPLERRVGRPPLRLRVHFACNDERGNFAGRAWMAQPESLYRVGRHPWDAELVHDDWGRGVALTVDDTMMKLRIHRVWFPFKAHNLCSDRTQARFNDPTWVDRHIETDIANFEAASRAKRA